MGFRLSATAEADVDGIWLYIARDNVDAANRFVEGMFECFAMLGRNKLAGVSRDDLEPGMRSISFGRYLIFYFPLGSGVEISQVIHSARDLNSIFEGDYEN